MKSAVFQFATSFNEDYFGISVPHYFEIRLSNGSLAYINSDKTYSIFSSKFSFLAHHNNVYHFIANFPRFRLNLFLPLTNEITASEQIVT